VLDPSVRRAGGSQALDLKGRVVIVDEAHNVENTLRESGSCDVREFDLCRLMNVLMVLASISTRNKEDVLSVEGKDGRVNENSYPEVAHGLLLFVERLVLYMRNSRIKFESSPGKPYIIVDSKSMQKLIAILKVLRRSNLNTKGRGFRTTMKLKSSTLDQVGLGKKERQWDVYLCWKSCRQQTRSVKFSLDKQKHSSHISHVRKRTLSRSTMQL